MIQFLIRFQANIKTNKDTTFFGNSKKKYLTFGWHPNWQTNDWGCSRERPLAHETNLVLDEPNGVAVTTVIEAHARLTRVEVKVPCKT